MLPPGRSPRGRQTTAAVKAEGKGHNQGSPHIRAGYALVDTAELYGNEALVGRAVRRSGVHRESLWLSSKAGHWCTSPPPAALLSQLPAQYRHLGALYPTSRGTLCAIK